jgi:squalene-hopene/tetraprenyl-beta-curcumene cyclase
MSQNPDGGWGPEPYLPSTASSTGLAVASLLLYYDVKDGSVQKGLAYLTAGQDEKGAWNGHPEMYGPRPLISQYQTHTQAFAAVGLVAAYLREKAPRRRREDHFATSWST